MAEDDGNDLFGILIPDHDGCNQLTSNSQPSPPLTGPLDISRSDTPLHRGILVMAILPPASSAQKWTQQTPNKRDQRPT